MDLLLPQDEIQNELTKKKFPKSFQGDNSQRSFVSTHQLKCKHSLYRVGEVLFGQWYLTV